MPRRGRDFWEAAVARLAASGLSQQAFADRYGLSVDTLRSWIYRLRRDQADRPALLPVRVIASTAPTARRQGDEATPLVEVELPSGVRLRFPVGADPDYVAGIAHRLASAC